MDATHASREDFSWGQFLLREAWAGPAGVGLMVALDRFVMSPLAHQQPIEADLQNCCMGACAALCFSFTLYCSRRYSPGPSHIPEHVFGLMGSFLLPPMVGWYPLRRFVQSPDTRTDIWWVSSLVLFCAYMFVRDRQYRRRPPVTAPPAAPTEPRPTKP